MRINPKHCLPAPLLVAMALAGCGGNPAEGLTEVFSTAIKCTVANCTESSTLNVDEISPKFTVTQNHGEAWVTVEGYLGKSANLATTVLLGSNETLTTSVDGGAEVPMSDVDGDRQRYRAQLMTASDRPVVRVVFTRAGVRHVNEVTMPASFTVLQPTGNPVLARTAPDVPVRLSVSTLRDASASASGTCTRTDNSSFSVTGVTLGYASEPSVAGGYRLNGTGTDDELNTASRRANQDLATTPQVARCQLTVGWARTEGVGTVAATMNQHGHMRPVRVATHLLTYDGQR